MKAREFIQKYKIVLLLSFLVVVLIVLKIKYSVPIETNIQEIIPTVTATPTISFIESYPEEMMEISE